MTSNAVARSERIMPWWVVLLEGIAAVIIGISLLATPLKTTAFLIQVLGWYWLITGIFSIVSIFIDHTAWGWKLFSGILGVIVGILVVNNPLVSTVLIPTTLVWILGFFGIIIGVITLIQAFQGGGWGAAILGVLSIIFGILLILNPIASAIALPWVVGVFAIVGGIAAIFTSFRLKK